MAKKIRIVYQLMPHVIGGAERFTFNLIKHLDRERFEPIIFSWMNGRVINLFKRLNVKIKIIEARYPNKLNELVSFLKSSKADIAQSTHFYAVLAMAADQACVPHVWRISGHVHGICSGLRPKEGEYLLKISAMLSKKLVCPTIFLKKQFRGVDRTKSVVIHNGVDIEHISRLSPNYNVLKRHGCANAHPAIAMVANLIPFKRHIDFILAAKIVKRHFPKAKYFILGRHDFMKDRLVYGKELRKKVKALGMENEVAFLEFCKERLTVMAAMDAIVLPSVGEGSSNAIIEAMALGKPVIASNDGGNPELIKNRVTGLLMPAKDPKSFAEAIMEILKNRTRANAMGLAGRQRAKKMFDIKKAVKRFERLYEDVYAKSTSSSLKEPSGRFCDAEY